jgi:hypothetical protein
VSLGDCCYGQNSKNLVGGREREDAKEDDETKRNTLDEQEDFFSSNACPRGKVMSDTKRAYGIYVICQMPLKLLCSHIFG